MNTRIAIALILAGLCGGCQVHKGTASTTNDPPTPFSDQQEVVYTVPLGQDPKTTVTNLESAVKWYHDFFIENNPNIRSVTADTIYPYASFMVGNIKVRLETHPRYLRLKNPVFYWTLPTVEQVNKKYGQLKRAGVRFERIGPWEVKRVPAKRKDNPAFVGKAAEDSIPEVQEFVAKDLYGNRIGVVNNPIYPPKID
ncbi:hypothetical protein KBK19_03910 [Microvirga sp. STR05]|uniref:Uncharacterized protein n=1 Tax=Hymenobacter duratus TaxID=2771356 RepID=A0ABR8JEM3_9BACT|nr:hypothetical protein [Hymenobacter duratus]MBD2714176.1 hypothetical protein [Hymenobacter duratus]MBR7949078.1 hypothetical protein [Microvirga sp. STR05]